LHLKATPWPHVVRKFQRKNENFVCKWMIENALFQKMLLGPLEVNEDYCNKNPWML